MNARFGYSISYPVDILYPQGEADNGDGQEFLSKNADAKLLVYATNNALNESLEDQYLEISRGGMSDNPKRVVTYKTLKNNWYVVSGYNSGKVFYQKTILHNDQFQTLYFEYDENKKNIYDSLLRGIFQNHLNQYLTDDNVQNRETYKY
jgi:hypothetical protein